MAETPEKMYALAVVLTLLAAAATVLRFYARYIKKAGFSWDDLALFPALVCPLLFRPDVGGHPLLLCRIVIDIDQLSTIATAICIIIGMYSKRFHSTTMLILFD